MRGLASSTGHNILQIGLLVCTVLSELNAVPTHAATTHYYNGRRMTPDTTELEGSIAGYRQLLNHEQFASRNLMQGEKERDHENELEDVEKLKIMRISYIRIPNNGTSLSYGWRSGASGVCIYNS